MQRHIHGNLAYYTFDSLSNSDTLVHAVSTRHGGVSPVPFDTLNLSFSAGDIPANVETNIRRFHDALNLDLNATVFAKQAQADRIAIVHAEQHGTRIPGVDALLTQATGMPLMLHYADCVPILFFDPVRRAIAIAHAGWRGTVGKIATKTVQAMSAAFGTHPRDLIACIAPSIGPCCYEVGENVIARVRDSFANADDLLIQQTNSRVHFDLWQANATQLRALGVEQIEIAGLCTADHTDDFYSWRKEKANTGRFAAIIEIRD